MFITNQPSMQTTIPPVSILAFALAAGVTSSSLRAAGSTEGNVALATAGAQVTADSTGVFGRNDPTYGAADQDITPGRLIDAMWVEKAGDWQVARGKRLGRRFRQRGIEMGVTEHVFKPVRTRYARLLIETGEQGDRNQYGRIFELEIYSPKSTVTP